MINVQNALVGKPGWNTPLRVTGVNGSIKIDFRVIGLECVDCIHVGQYADCFKYGNEQLGSIKSAKFLYS
jgi:hypothetical protein